MFEKCNVNGNKTCDIYKFLRCNSELYDSKSKEAKVNIIN